MASGSGRIRWGMIVKGVVPVLTIALVGGAIFVLPEWLMTLPLPVRRRYVESSLRVLVVGYWTVVVIALPGTVVLTALVYRSWKRRVRRPSLARCLLLSVSLLVGLALMEGGASVWGAWVHRMPALPRRLPSAPAGEIELAVIGESSARGEPFHPWLSIGQIVGWKLEQAMPRRRVHVNVLAEAGVTLERMHQKLERLVRRPDALIVYCGHNEFQARFDWGRNAGFGDMAFHPVLDRLHRMSLYSPLCRMIFETIDKHRLDAPPPIRTHSLVDPPLCSASESEAVLSEFRRRLEAIVAYCDQVGTLPILVIPPGNDGGFEPNRSSLPASVAPAERRRFTREFQEARGAEDEPDRAIAAYRALAARYPGFAETHFRLGRLLARQGNLDEANRHYTLARDCDTFPQRCPSPFQDVYRAVAARHRCPLVDGPVVLRAASPAGILDDNVFQDAQHPALSGHIALAGAVLDELRRRRALGWREGTIPPIDPAECASHFGLGAPQWSAVCERSRWFYGVTASNRFDPTERKAEERRYAEAGRQIDAGRSPEETGVPGLGTRPAPVADPNWASRPDRDVAGRVGRPAGVSPSPRSKK